MDDNIEINSSKQIFFSEALREAEEIARLQIERMENSHKESKVLIIATGGTICMFDSPKGLVVKEKYIQKFLQENSNFCDSDYTYFHSKDNFLITPETIFGKRVHYKVEEFSEIFDSSNIDINIWMKIGIYIEKNYEKYDGFIILHGTDTMAYTSSVLSFMLENLNKTVILTGGQIPLSKIRNDSFSNLLNSILIAGNFNIPEVMILFRNHLYRGNRVKKYDSNDFSSFDSPNMEPLATLGLNFEIKWEKLLKPNPRLNFCCSKNLSNEVILIKMHPGISYQNLKKYFESDFAKAIIIESYGSNMHSPISQEEINGLIFEYSQKGKIIVNVNQCYKYDGNYSENQENYGLIQALDMTLEATLAKLSYLLGKKLETNEIKLQLTKNLRGELTPIQREDQFEIKEEHLVQSIAHIFSKKNSSVNLELLRSILLPNIVCYLSKHNFLLDFLKELQTYNANYSMCDFDGRTPLHIACKEGNLEVVKFLTNECCDVNAIDKNGRSPLYEALTKKNKEIIIFLKEKGANLLAPHEEITDLILKSSFENNVDMLILCKEAGVTNWNSYVNYDKRNIAHIAVANNNVEYLNYIKKYLNFDFQIKDRWDISPIDEMKQLGNKKLNKAMNN